MSHIRIDPFTGHKVIIAPERGNRPGAYLPRTLEAAAPFMASCPFCPGNEEDAIVEYPAEGDWRIRVQHNKFPIVRASSDPAEVENIPHALALAGAHELLVTHRRHDIHITAMSQADLQLMFQAVHDRFCALSAQPDTLFPTFFLNSGIDAGGSQPHPHAQIFATSEPSRFLSEQLSVASARYSRENACPYCDFIQGEQTGPRILASISSFTALCPVAPRVPWEVWVLPHNHQPSFASLRGEELVDLSRLLHGVLQAMRSRLGEIDLNMSLISPPADHADRPDFHWQLHILPRLNRWGGMEIGHSFPIVDKSPEDAAKELKPYLG